MANVAPWTSISRAFRSGCRSRDCGAHEWYRADADAWRCYHCTPAIAVSSPWTREEQLQHTLGGIDSTLRLLAHAGDADDELQLEELRRLVAEALAALPEETRRLERLASTPVEKLPRLAQALRAA
jgi:hypothetical protein